MYFLELGDGRSSGIHCYVAGLIPAVTPRYCTKKIEKCSLEHKKTKEKKFIHELRVVTKMTA
jgi:hypothetical protein